MLRGCRCAAALNICIVLLAGFVAESWCAGSTSGGAEAWLEHVDRQLRAQADRLAAVSAAADRAAPAFIAGAGLVVTGDPGLTMEWTSRPGGFRHLDSKAGVTRRIVVSVLGLRSVGGPARRDLLQAQLQAARFAAEGGDVVVAIGSRAEIASLGRTEALRRAEAAGVAVLDTGDPSHGRSVLIASIGWTWQVELYAACTRLGRAPVVIRPEGRGSNRRGRGRLHPLPEEGGPRVAAIPAEVLGRRYLRDLRAVLRDVGVQSWAAIRSAADRGAAAIEAGGTAWRRVRSPLAAYRLAMRLDADPGLLRPLTGDLMDGFDRPDRPGPRDFVLAVGGLDGPATECWGPNEILRRAGFGVCYSFADVWPRGASGVREDDLLLDQRWTFDDAVLTVRPDLDRPKRRVRLGPVGGVIGEAVLWLVQAEMLLRLEDRNVPRPERWFHDDPARFAEPEDAGPNEPDGKRPELFGPPADDRAPLPRSVIPMASAEHPGRLRGRGGGAADDDLPLGPAARNRPRRAGDEAGA